MTHTPTNTKAGLLIHIIAWVIILVSPFLFFPHRGSIGLINYICGLFNPLMMGIMFYLNYIVLVRRLYIRGHRWQFLIVNTACVVMLGLMMERTNQWLFGIQFPDVVLRHMQEGRHFGWVQIMLFNIRSILLLAVAAAFGTLIRISLYWQRAEERRREAELGEAEAKLQNLQSQVNPHFLLNTLNNIYVLTELDKEKAQEAIMQLSQMMRYLLYKSSAMKVPLTQEIDFLKNYISLMRIRMDHNVQIHADLNINDASSILIAPHIFICLVENAFKHGVSATTKSYISIKISVDESNLLLCDIRNSNNPKSGSDKSGSGIGLKLVQQRLDLIYPHRYIWIKGVEGEDYHSQLRIQADRIDAFPQQN